LPARDAFTVFILADIGLFITTMGRACFLIARTDPIFRL
jgi:hypothetical protein